MMLLALNNCTHAHATCIDSHFAINNPLFLLMSITLLVVKLEHNIGHV